MRPHPGLTATPLPQERGIVGNVNLNGVLPASQASTSPIGEVSPHVGARHAVPLRVGR
jgi:hypothetical protein